MKLSQAATIILTTSAAVAVGAFVVPQSATSTHRRVVSASSYPSTGATTKKLLSPLAMSDSAVMDAETVEEGAETYE